LYVVRDDIDCPLSSRSRKNTQKQSAFQQLLPAADPPRSAVYRSREGASPNNKTSYRESKTYRLSHYLAEIQAVIVAEAARLCRATNSAPTVALMQKSPAPANTCVGPVYQFELSLDSMSVIVVAAEEWPNAETNGALSASNVADWPFAVTTVADQTFSVLG